MSIQIVSTSLPSLFAGVYDTIYLNVSCSAANGTYLVTRVSGTLPPGLAISASGRTTLPARISGTATATGVFTIGIKVTNNDVRTETDTRTFTIYITAGHLIRNEAGHLTREPTSCHLLNRKRGTSTGTSTPPSILTTALPDMIVGSAYSYQLTASGGVLPYTWSVLSGSFPSGISLSSAGIISGTTAAAPGAFSVTIKCAGADAAYATRTFALTLRAPTSNVIFTIETDQYFNETNMLFVYDPAGYGYCAADGSAGGYTPSFYFPYPGQSMPLGGGIVYYNQYPTNPVSPNGGYATSYRAETPYDYSVKWQSSTSPAGVFKFWVERTYGSTLTPLAFRYRIYQSGALYWERTGSGVSSYSASRRYSQLWTFNTITGQVY
jgi:hypothetical protein